MSNFAELFVLPKNTVNRYLKLQENQEEDAGVDWLVQIQLATDEFDDSFDSNYREQVVVTAPDFDTAYKYAHQYIRTMQLKDDHKDTWKGAEIICIHQQ